VSAKIRVKHHLKHLPRRTHYSRNNEPLTLAFENITQSKAGVYECIVESGTQKVLRRFDIRVVMSPKIESLGGTGHLREGMNCTLKATYQSNKKITVTWKDELGNMLEEVRKSVPYSHVLSKLHSRTIHSIPSPSRPRIQRSTRRSRTRTSQSMPS
jgi:hypothetical protein